MCQEFLCYHPLTFVTKLCRYHYNDKANVWYWPLNQPDVRQNVSDYIEKCRAEPQNVTLDEDHSNGFYFDIDEDIMAEDSYDRSGSLEVEDDGIEDYLTWWCRGRHRHLC